MYLELGIFPVKFVLMKKIMNFLHYILKEDTDSMLYKVFCALEEDSKRGYFIVLTNIDRKERDIVENNADIKSISNYTWKRDIREKVRCVALQQIKLENQSK